MSEIQDSLDGDSVPYDPPDIVFLAEPLSDDHPDRKLGREQYLLRAYLGKIFPTKKDLYERGDLVMQFRTHDQQRVENLLHLFSHGLIINETMEKLRAYLFSVLKYVKTHRPAPQKRKKWE